MSYYIDLVYKKLTLQYVLNNKELYTSKNYIFILFIIVKIKKRHPKEAFIPIETSAKGVLERLKPDPAKGPRRALKTAGNSG